MPTMNDEDLRQLHALADDILVQLDSIHAELEATIKWADHYQITPYSGLRTRLDTALRLTEKARAKL